MSSRLFIAQDQECVWLWRVCVLPEQTYADSAALSESTKTKPLFAVDVGQDKGEILPHLTLRNPEMRANTHTNK